MVIRIGQEQDPAKRIRQAQGAKIQQARKLHDMSRAELAERCGVSLGAITHWENGVYSPRQHHQVALCRALNVPHSLVFGLDAA